MATSLAPAVVQWTLATRLQAFTTKAPVMSLRSGIPQARSSFGIRARTPSLCCRRGLASTTKRPAVTFVVTPQSTSIVLVESSMAPIGLVLPIQFPPTPTKSSTGGSCVCSLTHINGDENEPAQSRPLDDQHDGGCQRTSSCDSEEPYKSVGTSVFVFGLFGGLFSWIAWDTKWKWMWREWRQARSRKEGAVPMALDSAYEDTGTGQTIGHKLRARTGNNGSIGKEGQD